MNLQETPPATAGNTMRTANDIARDYREVVDALDDVRRREKELNRRRAELDAEVVAWCERQGLESLPGEGITLSIREADVVRIDDWDAAVAWAIDHGLTSAIQKRVTASRIREAVEAGVPLPDALELDTIRRVAMRRNG